MASFSARAAVRTVQAAAPPRRSLLGYRLRPAAAQELLHGVRVTNLVVRPPDVVTTRSEELPLPTLAEERADLELNWATVQMQLVPNNLYHETRYEVARLKNVDLKRRHLPAARFHPPASELRIAPQTKAEWGAGRPFRPFQSLKPVGTPYQVAGRQSGLRHQGQAVRQERLNQRGLGWKRIMRDMWTLPAEGCWSYHPKRGY